MHTSSPASSALPPSQPLSAAQRRALLLSMMRIRLIEEAIAGRYKEQQMRCPVHLSIGQEAIAAGVSEALAPGDYVMSTHRSHAHYLGKGGSVRAFLAELYGRATGCCGGHGGSMHLIDMSVNMLGSTPIVGNVIPVATGVAFASWMRDEKDVTVVYLGDGATEEGAYVESINFASVHKLPIVYVVENNYFSVYSPLSVRQNPERSVVRLAEAHGIAAAHGDGNDAEACYQLARVAVEHARSGAGPYVLELDTYRWREHCGPNFDNDLGYHSVEEYEAWLERDPVARCRAALLESGELTLSDIEAHERAIQAEIEDGFRFALASPFPTESDFGRVYATEIP